MRLTAHTDYSLRLLIYLALRPDTPATIAAVAAANDLSQHHLAKVSQNLVRLGYLRATRGRNGGISLAVPAGEINLGDLMRSIEPDWNIVGCFSDPDSCAISPACRLKGLLKDATDAFLGVLDRHSVGDLIANRQRLGTLLGVEVIPLTPAGGVGRVGDVGSAGAK